MTVWLVSSTTQRPCGFWRIYASGWRRFRSRTPGQDPADGVWPPRGGPAQEAGAWQTGDLHLPGVTLICATSRKGHFQIRRKTRGDRMQATLKRVKDELRERMHEPIPEQGEWLAQVVMGFFAYHAYRPTGRPSRRSATPWCVTGSARSRGAVRTDASPGRAWCGWPPPGSLRPASCTHGLANASTSHTQGGSRVPESGPLGSVRGARSNVRSYRDPVRERAR